MEKLMMLNDLKSLSVNEQTEVFGGGGISDGVVKILTWIGDHLPDTSPSGEYHDIMHGAR